MIKVKDIIGTDRGKLPLISTLKDIIKECQWLGNGKNKECNGK